MNMVIVSREAKLFSMETLHQVRFQTTTVCYENLI